LGRFGNHFGMIVQKLDMLHLIQEAQRGKRVAVGGPYVTSVPESAQEAGKLVLARVRLPALLVEALIGVKL